MGITWIHIDSTDIRNLKVLNSFKNIEDLNLGIFPPSDIESLKEFPEVKVLAISNDKLKSLDLLTKFKKVNNVTLYLGKVNSLASIKELSH